MFGARAIADPNVKPGEGASRLCLSAEANSGERRYRQFVLELIGYNESAHEVQVRLYASKPLTRSSVSRRRWIWKGSARSTRTSSWISSISR